MNTLWTNTALAFAWWPFSKGEPAPSEAVPEETSFE